ncbi:MAG: hypothetical protein P1S46_08315 [bacterium]|nr:hypothetical protein [bacterium]
MTIKRKTALTILSVSMCLLPAGPALAEELTLAEGCGTEAARGYGGCVGFNGLSIDGGGETVMPYGYLESHPVLKAHYHEPVGLGLLDLSLDYGGDGYYNLTGDYYGTSASAVIRSERFVRNLEHLNLPGPYDTSTSPLYWSDDTDPADEYSLDLSQQFASIKYKWHAYPANASLSVRRFQVEGEKQQFILNENCATQCHHVSETRKIRTTTDQISLGGSGHAGFVDVSYQYRGTQFKDDQPDPVFNYDSVFGFTGTQAHNIYPETKVAEHTVNVSTNHTGRFAGFLGVILGERENTESSLTEQYQNAIGRFLWRPNTRFSLLLDSRQTYRQDDSPDAALQAQRLADGAPLRYGTVRNCNRATVNYYPADGVDLQGVLTMTAIEREDNELWGLPDETTSSEVRMTARLKPSSAVKVRATWSGITTEDPSYRTTPTDSQKLMVSGQWIPAAGVCLTADVKGFSDENSDSGLVNERQILGAGVSYTSELPVSLVFRVYQFTNDITTDVTLADSVPAISDDDVPYTAEGTQYMLQAVWRAGKKLQVAGQYTYLMAEGDYDVSTAGFTDVSDYSGLDAVQQESAVDLLYTMDGGWGISARLANLSYEDKESGLEDEKVNQVSASVTKRW